MDPVIIAGGLAVAFALIALLLWRRAAELADKVRQLEAKLAEHAAAAAATSAPVSVEALTPSEEVPQSDEPPRSETEELASEPPTSNQTTDAVTERDESAETDAPIEEAGDAPSEPSTAEAETPAPTPDRLRVEALKVVAEAFELARYLDFDAIVEKPSTYRVEVPITAANGEAVRYLEDGMFRCLSHVRIEDDTAILHIDTGKGPP